MTVFRALMMGFIGVVAIGYAIRSALAGMINIGGKNRAYFVTFSDEPGLFVFGVIFLLVLGGGSCLLAWRHFTGKDEVQ